MAEAVLAGIRYSTRDDVYDPHDDTELLLEAVEARSGQNALDLGCGAGLIGIRMRKQGARVTCADLNMQALKLTHENARRNAVDVSLVRTDLTTGLRLRRFDVVAFNPPYLPTTERDRVETPLNYAFDGGHEGLATTNRFLDACKEDSPGRVFIVGSSLQGNGGVEQSAKDRGMRVRVACTKNLSWETLTVYDLSPAKGSVNHEHHP